MGNQPTRDQMKTYMKKVNHLRAIGVGEKISLPQVVVVGDQSSGKSSLLESITEIPLPKGTGTVTRCPTVVTITTATKPDEKLSISVAVRSIEEKDMSPFFKIVQGKSKGRWKLTTMDQLREKLQEIHGIIVEFQSEGKKKTIIRDLIEVHVEYPSDAKDVSELSIVDLPGIVVTNTKDQDKSIVEEIKEMVHSFIKKPNTIILAVMEATKDLSTSQALSMAETVDKKGTRTIGVLTKCDRVEDINQKDVVSILENKTKWLSMGYFAVKNRSGSQQNLSIAKGLIEERTFFNGVSDYRSVRSRCGNENLRRCISSQLMKIIQREFPRIKNIMREKMERCRTDLENLGPEPASDKAEIMMRFSDCLLHTQDSMKATLTTAFHISCDTGDEMTIWSHQLNVRKEFKTIIHKSRHVFPAHEYECKLKKNTKTVDLSASNLPEIHSAEEVKPGDGIWTIRSSDRIINGSNIMLPGYKPRILYHVVEVSKESSVKDSSEKKGMYQTIFNMIEKYRGPELPGFPSFEVFKKLASRIVSDWEKPTINFVSKVFETFKKQLMNIMAKSLQSMNLPNLQKRILTITLDWMNSHLQKCTKEVRENVYREKEHPLTENHYFCVTINELRRNRLLGKQMSADLKKTAIPGSITSHNYNQVYQTLVADAGKTNELIHKFNKARVEEFQKLGNEESEVLDMMDKLKSYLKMFKHIKESLRKIPESEVQSLILRDEYTEQMRNALQKELEMLQDGMKQLEVDAFL
eukprot:CAMPEP_0167765702 /NCGR_PEP_ID=MMETSP0110_2-20121227/14865_1 /TAXON_ID=629695 /ORGANISM="Gymnochlora sp., Strain CCMP2014" /LENGTH=749 /DNA_ID=CAMNT_0007653507 /DNA_START=188 /DNA_END=2437 /DNA_ORIENTATION=-